LLQSFVAIAQAQNPNYQKVMDRFVKYYNNEQGDSIVYLFSPEYREMEKRRWTLMYLNSLHEKYGVIKHCKYLNKRSNNEGSMAFEAIFSKIGKNGTSMRIDEQNYIVDFDLIMFPDAIPKAGKTK